MRKLRLAKQHFNFFEIALDNIFVSTFNKEIGLQFLMYLLSTVFLLIELDYSLLLRNTLDFNLESSINTLH